MKQYVGLILKLRNELIPTAITVVQDELILEASAPAAVQAVRDRFIPTATNAGKD